MSNGNVHSLKSTVAPPMMDDQAALVHFGAVKADGTAGVFPNGAVLTFVSDNPANGTAVPNTGQVQGTTADPLSCYGVGVKGVAGPFNIVATYANPDSTQATGSAAFTTTIDPAELDVASLSATVDAPIPAASL